jgi:hypothetical protein
LIAKCGYWINALILIYVVLPGVKQVFDVDLLLANIKTKKREKSCDEDEE